MVRWTARIICRSDGATSAGDRPAMARRHPVVRKPALTPACTADHGGSLNALTCRRERGSVTYCCSTRRLVRAAVEPECPGLYRADPEQSGRRPGICGKMCPYLVLICGLDGMQGLLAVTNWAAENDEAIVH